MSDAPIAFHITFGTYGTRLHGDDRGTVERKQNQFGDPIIDTSEAWECMERRHLNFDPRVFTVEQMVLVESLIPAVCLRGNWLLHTCAAGPDHVHNVLTPNDPKHALEGKSIRRWLKTWLGQFLAHHIPLQPGETFWSECGSIKWIWTDDYFDRAVDYVRKQRAIDRQPQLRP